MSSSSTTKYNAPEPPTGFINIGYQPILTYGWYYGDCSKVWPNTLVHTPRFPEWLTGQQAHAKEYGFHRDGLKLTSHECQYAVSVNDDTIAELLTGHDEKKFSLNPDCIPILKAHILKHVEQTNDIPIYEL